MDDIATTRRITEWDMRPWALAALLGAAGLLVYILTDGYEDSGFRSALAALVTAGAIAFAFTLDRDLWKAPAIFAAIVGLVLGGLVWRAVGQGDDLAASQYGIMAGLLAAGLSLPLFQAGFHHLRWRTSYPETHYHAWTDAISVGGSFAFLGLSWIVLWLVARLLDLVGIPLDELIQQDWFGWTFSGAAFGAALGVLRNQLKILGTLQSLVMTIFSLLAVPLALAVVLFLAAVVVSGPSVLWDATDSATPILLAIAAGSFLLVNAVIRDDAAGMTPSPVLQVAARILALGVLPLTVFAAISMGVRIDQYGLTPERLWGLAAAVVAVAYGTAYFVDVVRGWKGGWSALLRGSNLKLAVGTAVYALVLALPILNFGSLSTANQVARLESGAVPPQEFDFDALKWDFGEPGREALAGLAESSETRIATLAKQAQARKSKPWRYRRGPHPDRERKLAKKRRDNLTIDGGSEAQRTILAAWVGDSRRACYDKCRAIFLGPLDGGTHVAMVTQGSLQHLLIADEGTVRRLYNFGGLLRQSDEREGPVAVDVPDLPQDGETEIRPYTGRQLYIDGKPVGDPFE
ncbi:DUF4153 domain-containing protein [Pseudoblastomonas halimionae]|uniref:DUF4153 domain-containing protein n=1 Tax=Alteriqipengyuania halimionae TaxID=1926630 RepID=A0A6I4U2G8_9SPHN|nr:DUF4153 domain-containing protein [Alteriqipengyuania halimionae]MXP10210.1 DUF4153 domain-containing protein [Alteriqipengyuania halimionae]